MLRFEFEGMQFRIIPRDFYYELEGQKGWKTKFRHCEYFLTINDAKYSIFKSDFPFKAAEYLL